MTRYSRGELQELLRQIEQLGEIGVFGGLLRDSALARPQDFKSDVDLVVNVQDEKSFDRLFRAREAQLNRFGGYRLILSQGSVDVWPLHRTWAFQMGIRRGSSLQDLIGTTYFSWDSIVYSWSSHRVYCRDTYLRDVRERVVELELAENPHPVGALVRTLRLIASGRAGLGRRLAHHTLFLLENHSVEDILSVERRGYRVSYLGADLVRAVQQRLKHFVATESEPVFSRPPAAEQLSFPFVRHIALAEAAAFPSGMGRRL